VPQSETRAGRRSISALGSAALLDAESRFNRLRGYRQIPHIVKEIELAILKVETPAILAGVA
jgi:hypothetical protein